MKEELEKSILELQYQRLNLMEEINLIDVRIIFLEEQITKISSSN